MMMLTLLRKVKQHALSNIKYVKRRLDQIKLNATSLFDNGQFPTEFDEIIYKKNYSDLSQYSNDQLYAHYKNQGEKEGRRANLLQNRIDFVRHIPAGKKILEIGPFFKPLTSGKNVSYFDILDQADLKVRAAALGFPREAADCPEIHFVSPTGDLSIVNEKFDVVLSSHCIEHQPNLIKHFNSVEKLLKPGGFYFLLAPDKRYCFDHFLPESNLAQVIDVYVENRTFHSLRNMLENRVLTTHNETNRHWQGDHGERYSLIREKVANAIAEHKKAQEQGIYIDLHAWYFTPDSFKQIHHALNELAYTQLCIERIYPTLYGNNEFWVILKKP